jgi:CheY-like chemotaxis protein
MDAETLIAQAGEATYKVICHACQREYDAALAPWCMCITNARSLACPACGGCSCSAPKAYRDKFWAEAPQELCRRRFAEKTASFEPGLMPDPRSEKRPLILVADDERVILRLASKLLQGKGYTVLTAKDGLETLRIAKEHLPDLLLTDALMPKMDGREVCKQLKLAPQTSAIKVIIMTSAYTAPKYKTEALTAYRADEYITKPVDFKLLSALLKKLL